MPKYIKRRIAELEKIPITELKKLNVTSKPSCVCPGQKPPNIVECKTGYFFYVSFQHFTKILLIFVQLFTEIQGKPEVTRRIKLNEYTEPILKTNILMYL